MRISDWSSDVCSSDLDGGGHVATPRLVHVLLGLPPIGELNLAHSWSRIRSRMVMRVHSTASPSGYSSTCSIRTRSLNLSAGPMSLISDRNRTLRCFSCGPTRSEEQTSELPSPMPHTSAVFC